MYSGILSAELKDLIRKNEARFGDNDEFSLFNTSLDHDALVEKLSAALATGKTYDPVMEEWSEEGRARYLSGTTIG